MTEATVRHPRPYWTGMPDQQLQQARTEYQATGDPELTAVADAITDELERRRIDRASP